jgi:hypothetical protein
VLILLRFVAPTAMPNDVQSPLTGAKKRGFNATHWPTAGLLRRPDWTDREERSQLDENGCYSASHGGTAADGR